MKVGIIGRASVWAALGVGGAKAISLATTAVLARLLLPGDFGIVALATVVLSAVYLVQDLGLSPALVQYRGDAFAAGARMWRVHLAVAAALTLLVAALAPLLERVLGAERLAPVLLGLTPGILARGAGLVPRALLQRRLSFRAIAAADVLSLAVRAALAIPLALRGAGAWSLVAGDVGSMIAHSVLCWGAHGRLPPGTAIRGRDRRALLAFGRPVTIAGLIGWARDGLARGAVGVLIGPTALGYYDLAARLSSVPVTGITHVSNRVAFPVYAAATDGAALRRMFKQSLRIVSALTIPACAGLISIAPTAVEAVFGARWLPIVVPLRLLLAASMATSLAAMTGELFKAVGRPDYLLRTGVPHVCLLALGIAAAAPYGLVGVAWAVSGVRVLMSTVGIGLALRMLRMPLRDLLEALAPAAAATAVMVTVLTAIRHGAVRVDALQPAVSLALQCALGAATYALALGALRWRQLSLVIARGTR